jgi:broad specificity phosphatase PhoE
MLTKDSRIKINHLAEWLHEENIDVIYSSPLQRCIDTIEPFSKKEQLPIIIDSRITEFRFDCMQDKSWNDVSAEFNTKLHSKDSPKQD